mgnify:CR=1 FL=1
MPCRRNAAGKLPREALPGDTGDEGMIERESEEERRASSLRGCVD